MSSSSASASLGASGKHVIYWFRKALRLHDNPSFAAAAACASAPGAALFPVFALAENYRSEPGVLAAAEAARKLASLSSPDENGSDNVTTLSLVGNMPMNSGNRYHGSKWRRDPEVCFLGFLFFLFPFEGE